MRRWLWTCVVIAGCSNGAGPKGDPGPEGPPGPRGLQGPAGARAVLRDAQSNVVGLFVSSGEIYFPGIGCSLRLFENDATGDQDLDGNHDDIFFTSDDCTGLPYTIRTQYETTCLVSQFFSPPIGTKPGGTKPTRPVQQAVTLLNARLFRFHAPMVRLDIQVNSRLTNNDCVFLDTTSYRAFRLDEINPPLPSSPLSIGTE